MPCIAFKCDSGLRFVLFVCDSLTVNQFDYIVILFPQSSFPCSHILLVLSLCSPHLFSYCFPSDSLIRFHLVSVD